MKTEKEFSEFFFDSCEHAPAFADFVRHTSTNYWSDMTAHVSEYFSSEDRLAITEKAARRLSDELKSISIHSSDEAMTQAWVRVIRNFIDNRQWGYETVRKKPKAKQTEEQKIFWKLFRYTWAFFQSMVILKIAVYYFGLESADKPDETSVIWVWLFFGLSAGSLAYFAYRNRNDQGN